jgi:hypothetical protein
VSGSDRYAGSSATSRDRTAGNDPSAAPALDAEMLDLVRRFEKGYAELAPAAEEPPRRDVPAEELFPEFPDVFEELTARSVASESARVVPMPRRESEAASQPPAPVPAWQREAAADKGGDVDLDEAMAILRASEQSSRRAPQPQGEHTPVTPRVSAAPPRARFAEQRENPTADAGRRPRAEGPSAVTDRVTRSQIAWTAATAAAVASLAVGVAAGYFIGRSPSAKPPSAPIESSTQGGTQLRLERNLPKL